MNALLELSLSPESVTALLAYFAKTSVIFVIAAVVTATLRGVSASARHWVWTLAFISSVLLLPLSVLLPTWSPANVLTVPVETVSQSHLATSPPMSLPSAALAGVGSADPASPGLSAGAVEIGTGGSAPVWTWVLAIYLAGVIATALYYLVGALAARRLVSRARLVTDEDLLALSSDVSWEMCLKKPVELRWHEGAASPMTFGVRHPIVLLPREAAQWSEERHRLVLLHELAHVERRDCLIQTIVQAACAVNWFNPLVWWAQGRVRAERERACDDHVLNHGTRPSTYAEHLLDIARRARVQIPPVGVVAMARRSELEGRLMAILEPGLRRRPVGRVVSVVSGALFAAGLCPLAALSPDVQAETWELPALVAESQPGRDGAAVVTGDRPDDVVQRTFDVGEGGTLRLDTDVGSVQVRSGESDRVHIVVHRRGRHDADPEDLALSFEQRGNDVVVRGQRTAEARQRQSWSMNVTFDVTVPYRYNVDVNTAGGSVSVEDLEGEVETRTSGGGLTFGRISGNVTGRTSGGSIRLSDVTGNANLITSGGSIEMGRVRGDVDARTSGGGITVTEVQGRLSAVTSGGPIRARMTEPPQSGTRLQTSGGSISLELSGRAAVNLDAETSAGRVSTDFDVPSRDPRRLNALRAPLNGGGPDLILKTSAGNITISRLDESTGSLRPPNRGDVSEDAFELDEHLEALMHEVFEGLGKTLAAGELVLIFTEAVVDIALDAVAVATSSLVDANNLSLTIEQAERLVEVLANFEGAGVEEALKKLERDHPDSVIRKAAGRARRYSVE